MEKKERIRMYVKMNGKWKVACDGYGLGKDRMKKESVKFYTKHFPDATGIMFNVVR